MIKFHETKRPEFYNKLSGTQNKNMLALFDEKNGVDIRVDYVAQRSIGSAYKTAPYRLASYAEAILNGSYDAELIVIREGFIPAAFIKYFVNEVKRNRFCYYVIADAGATEKDISQLIEAQLAKIHSDVLEWKK